MSWADQVRAYEEEMKKANAYNERVRKEQEAKKARAKKAAESRKVKFVAPGHTRIYYAHRTLEITFPETQKQFEAKKKRHAKASRARTVKRNGPRKRSYEIKDEYTYRRYKDMYDREMAQEALARDEYNTEEMRALLKDEHWEEECGHSRWKTDDKSLVREFKKYLESRRLY